MNPIITDITHLKVIGDLQELTNQCRALIRQGWQPLGPAQTIYMPNSTTPTYLQTLIFYGS